MPISSARSVQNQGKAQENAEQSTTQPISKDSCLRKHTAVSIRFILQALLFCPSLFEELGSAECGQILIEDPSHGKLLRTYIEQERGCAQLSHRRRAYERGASRLARPSVSGRS